MKRTISSIQNGREVQASQPKRIRGDTAKRQQENNFDTTDDHDEITSQKRWSKKDSQHMKGKLFSGESDRENDCNITTSTPTTSSISISTSSKRLPLSQKAPSSLNQQTTIEHSASQSVKLTEKVKGSVSLSRTTSSKGNTKANSTSIKSTDKTDRNTAHSNLQMGLSSSSTNKSRTTNTQNSTTSSTFNDHPASSRSSSSSSIHDLNNSRSNDFPNHSLIEGSIEYRELKRLYGREKNLVEEWQKDYRVLKAQLNYLKSSTIPRPTAAFIEWLEELFNLMKDNKAFPGDGRTLNSIGDDLGLDPANLVSVAARTPQKSALKLFRLLYPTIGSRAECGSITKIPKEQLDNIYIYVRTLHPNLTYHIADMKNAIGTSIRSARSELRRSERYQQHHLNVPENEENLDLDEQDDRNGGDSNDGNDESDDGDNDDQERGDEDDDEIEEDDSGAGNLLIDDEIDEVEEED